VVPAAAVQRSARGTFVDVIRPDQTVAARPVTTGVVDGDDVAVTAGLTVGEQVVVDGADRLRDGVRVTVPSAATITPPAGRSPGSPRGAAGSTVGS
jgi:multidrug efflux system membrane fusion protein